ncbi:MAG: hypothetical protein OXC09_07265 [Truepera sp.]|nr:hypothetical protein [Truepera sp.]
MTPRIRLVQQAAGARFLQVYHAPTKSPWRAVQHSIVVNAALLEPEIADNIGVRRNPMLWPVLPTLNHPLGSEVAGFRYRLDWMLTSIRASLWGISNVAESVPEVILELLAKTPTVKKPCADSGYAGPKLAERLRELGLSGLLEIVTKPEGKTRRVRL